MTTSSPTLAHINERASSHTNKGILAAALHELRDFSPAFIPAGDPTVVATCPVCIGEPEALGALRVEVVDNPKRLNWFCSLHRGGFNGISYALGKHKSAQVSDLVLQENSASTKSDTAPEVDPAADHQKAHTCANWKTILHHIKDLGHLTAMPVRCRHCIGCEAWLKAKRVSRLLDASSDWASVCMVAGLDAKAFAAMSRRLLRHGAEYVSIPLEAGRTVLTNDATVGGTRIEPGDLHATIALLVRDMVEGRLSYSSAVARKPRKKQELSRERIGVTKLSAPEVAAVCLRHGVPVIPQKHGARERGATPLPTWDVSSLTPDALLGLWEALGVRTRGRK